MSLGAGELFEPWGGTVFGRCGSSTFLVSVSLGALGGSEDC